MRKIERMADGNPAVQIEVTLEDGARIVAHCLCGPLTGSFHSTAPVGTDGDFSCATCGTPATPSALPEAKQ